MTPEAIKQLLADHVDELWQFAGYVTVSGAALVVDVSVYWMLLALLPYAFVAAAGGYVCGVLAHYMISSRVVFRDRFNSRGVVVEAPTVAKFFAAGLSGLIVTAAIVGLLADVMGFHPLIAKICAAGCSFIVVFVTLRVFVFNTPPKGVPEISAAAAA